MQGSHEAFLNGKNLQQIDNKHLEAPEKLRRFLIDNGVDVTLWGIEKDSKTVDALYREVSSKKTCLCEYTTGNVTQLFRVVSSVRVRLQTKDGEILVMIENNNQGNQYVAPLEARLYFGMSALECAESLILKKTGLLPIRENSTHPDSIKRLLKKEMEKTKERVSRRRSRRGSSISLGTFAYSPLQYENPIEYVCQSSTTFPTLASVYAIHILTVDCIDDSVQIGAGTQLSLKDSIIECAMRGPRRRLIWVSPEQEARAVSHISLNSRHSLKTIPQDGQEEVSYEDLESESSSNHELFTTNNDFQGPPSALDHNENRLRSITSQALNKLRKVLDGWELGRASLEASKVKWIEDSKPQSRRLSTKIVTRSATFKKIVLRQVAPTDIFKHTSFDGSGNLLPLSQCPWWVVMQETWNQKKFLPTVRLSDVAKHVFHMWLVKANHDTHIFTTKQVEKLLTEVLDAKCQLLLHPTSKKLSRIVRLAKAYIYQTEDTNLPLFNDTQPNVSHWLTSQKISKKKDSQKLTMSFDVMHNKKTEDSEYMLHIVQDYVKNTFETLYSPDGQRFICNPYLRSVYMLEPVSEKNISPSYPGLSSVYYIHRFYVVLGGLPKKLTGPFYTTAVGDDLQIERTYWHWLENDTDGLLNSRKTLLEKMVQRPQTNLNLLDFMGVLRRGTNKLSITTDNLSAFKNMYEQQLKAACQNNDPKLVEFVTEKLLVIDAKFCKGDFITKHVILAVSRKAWKAAYSLLSIFVRKVMLKEEQVSYSLEDFNMVLIVASLINAKNDVIRLRESRKGIEKDLSKKIELYSAAPFCVIRAVQLGHAEMLGILLGMVPHFSNGPFMPKKMEGIVNKGDKIWDDPTTLLRRFQISTHATDLLVENGCSECRVFIPGYVKEVEDGLFTKTVSPGSYTERAVSIGKDAFTSFKRKLSYRVEPESDPRMREQLEVKPMGWLELLNFICYGNFDGTHSSDMFLIQQRTNLLGPKKTKTLGVTLAACPIDLVGYKGFLEIYLASLVTVCWNDQKVFGYELESKRMLLEFLKASHFPFHTAMLVADVYRKLKEDEDSYYNTEYSVLAEWSFCQAKDILDTCSSQEEANALLFEQVRIEPEITTVEAFSKREPTVSKDDVKACAETCALYLAVELQISNVVASPWFQGTNENRIWFYEWWRPDRFPAPYENHANSFFAQMFITLCILMELIVLLPCWCVAPFSFRVTSWRDSLTLNTAYFKFLSSTLLHVVFVFLVLMVSRDPGPRAADINHSVPMSTKEWIMYGWVAGLIWAELGDLYLTPRAYFSSSVNLVDGVFLLFFCAAFVTRLASDNASSQESPVLDYRNSTMSWLDENGDWGVFTYGSVSEVCLAFGALVSVYRFVHLSSFHEGLGPLYASILKMVSDFAYYVFLLLILLFGNSVGVVFLLRRYKSNSGEYFALEGGDEIVPGYMGTFNLLGRIIFSGEIPDLGVKMTPIDTYIFYILIVFHLVVIVIVLTNLLIALMNRSFELTAERGHDVYLNERMGLINDYIVTHCIPAPFNIVTLPFEITAMFVNHFRYGNSRATYQKAKSVVIKDFEFETVSELRDRHLIYPRRKLLRMKRKYNINNAMRKVRVQIMRRYFERVTKSLGVQTQNCETATKSIQTEMATETETPKLTDQVQSSSAVTAHRRPSVNEATDLGQPVKQDSQFLSPTVADYLLSRRKFHDSG